MRFRKLADFFILPIRGYQLLISPMLGSNCRHTPTCSQYMIGAIREWGPLRGIWLGLKRIARCHPWGTHGHDPVPGKETAATKLTATELEESSTASLQFHKRGGLLPVTVQETGTGQILMMAYVNEEAFRITKSSRTATFWSTSRGALWVKGATSGNTLTVDNILIDCDQDAIVYQVTLNGRGVCHTVGQDGHPRKACFYRELSEDGSLTFIEGMQ